MAVLPPPSGAALVIPFDDQSTSFAAGFEAGLIWLRIDGGESPLKATTRPTNRTFYQRLASHYGYSVAFTPREDGWDDTVFTTLDISKTTPSEGGLYAFTS